MKNHITLTILLLTTSQLLFAQIMPWQDRRPWQVLFEDSCTSFNHTLWRIDDNITHGHATDNTEEPQIYTSDNVYVSDGKYVLRTRRLETPLPHPTIGSCLYNNSHYFTSGQIQSNNTYQYGFFEIYAQLPFSDGYWPAFWFWNYNPGHWYNEIDVFEGDGSEMDSLSCCIWYSKNYVHADSIKNSGEKFSCNYTNGYHWYGVKWNNCRITWYYDREVVREIDNDNETVGICHPMFILMNTALFPPNWANTSITPSSIFPNYMLIDQINGYRLNCQDIDTDVFEIYDFNTYNYAIKRSISLTGSTVLPQNGDVSLYAARHISLGSGFYVPLGTTFSAEINKECDCQITILPVN